MEEKEEMRKLRPVSDEELQEVTGGGSISVVDRSGEASEAMPCVMWINGKPQNKDEGACKLEPRCIWNSDTKTCERRLRRY